MGTRDIYRRPFSWDSIWNLPLADTAQLKPVEAKVGDVYPDVENISVDPTAPVKHLSGGASGSGGVHVDPRLSADGSWNNCSTLLTDTPDKTTVVQGQPMKLSPGGDPSWEVGWKPESLTGPGIAGCHGGSGLSGIGGTIRHSELFGGEPIRHALKISLPCDTSCSAQNGGHRWPATTADSGFEANYHGTDPHMQMGSLLALPPTVDLSAITDPDVHKVAVALQTYGAYVVDSSGGPPAGSLDVEAGAVKEFPHINSDQMKQVFGQLAAVTNNSAATPGGGTLDAARRAPCAGAFTDGSGAAPATCGRGSTGSDAHLASGRTSTPTPTPTTPAPLPRRSTGTSNNAPPTTTGTSSPRTTGTSSADTSSAAGGATTTPAQGGDGGGVTWAMSGGLVGFETTPWNNEAASDPAAAASPNVPGRQAVKFAVPDGGKRSEAQPSENTFRSGDCNFFGYSGYLDKGFATEAKSWRVIWQLHDGGTNGSPPVALEIGAGKLWLATSGNDHDKDLGPVEPGQNIAVELEVQFAQGGGLVTVWRDGKQVLSNYKPLKGTMVDGSDYLKIGIYRDPSEGRASRLYLNDLKIGDSLACVSNLAGQSAAIGGGAAGPAAGAVVLLAPLRVAATAPPAGWGLTPDNLVPRRGLPSFTRLFTRGR